MEWAESLFWILGQKITHHPEFTVEIHYNEKNSLDNVLRYFKDNAMAITNLKIHTTEGNAPAKYAAEVFLRGAAKADALTDHVLRMPGIVSAIVL